MSASPAAPSSASVSAWAIDVAVGVADEATRMVDRDTAEHERHALAEGVRVDADADPQASLSCERG